MKTLKSILSLLLVTLCISSTFTSCEKTNVSGDTTLSSTDISSYKIVRVDAASGKLPTMTSNFKKAILEHTKAELEVTTDYVKRGEELDESGSEILIGDTNRTVSINALAELDEKGYEVDYIHGEEETTSVATKDNACGFLYSGINKSDLFPAIAKEGVLPRKTFSMGHAQDKRYSTEVRKIRKI